MESVPYYYGDIVRKIFIVCGLVMLITLPFLKENLTSPIFYSILTILILTFLAGMTDPKQQKIIIGDAIVSIIGFGVFSYNAVTSFPGFVNLFFLTNFSLAVLCLAAFYWSVKTIRWLKFPTKIGIGHHNHKLNELLNSNETDEIIQGGGKSLKEGGAFNVSEDTPAAEKPKMTEEERRRNRFLSEQ